MPIRWEEPFGMAVVEALASGTPVVAMRRGAMPVIIQHGYNGFLADSEEEFAEHLQRAGLGTLLMDLLTADEEQLDLRSRELRFDIGLLARRLVGAIDWLAPASAGSSRWGCSGPAPVRPPPWWPRPSGQTGWPRWSPAAAGRTWPARRWSA